MSGDDYSTYLTNDSNTADCSIDISATSTSDSSHAFNIIVKTNLAVNWDVSVSDADIYQVASPSGLEYQEIFEIPYYGDETPPIALLDKTDISISDLWYPADLGISGVIGDISGGNRKLYDLCSYGYNLISINNPESATGLIFTPNNLSDTDFSNVSIFDNLGSITEIDTAPEEGYDITAHEAKISQTHLRINLLNNPIDGVSSETFSLTISGETDTVNSRIGSLPQLDDEGYHTQDSGIMHLHNGTAYNNRFNGIGVCGITRNGYFIVTKDTKLYQPTFDSSGYITGYNPDSDKKQGCSGWKLDTSTNIMSRREDLANEIGIYTYNIEEEISNTLTVAGDNNKKKSLEILKSISKYADICELGFPHNTPIADGGLIQTSAYRAIRNGIKINDVFSIAAQFKKFKKNKPIILMGYYNMIYQYNENEFIEKCQKSKVDGLIVVDLPFPENKNFAKKCKKKNVNFIQLISPTTSKARLKQIIRNSHDMIYYISMLSTTGGKLKVSPKKILKEYSKIKTLHLIDGK